MSSFDMNKKCDVGPDEFDIDLYMIQLFKKEPFFAELSRRIEKVELRSIPTIGVRLNPRTVQYELAYNPEFMCTLTFKEIQGVLIHEFYHIVFMHITSRRPSEEWHKIWNIAADLAINCLIGKDRLPDMACFPAEGRFAELPAMMAAEAYFSKIVTEPEKYGMGDQAGGEGQFDSHDNWDDVPDEVKELAKQRAKEATEAAYNKAAKSNSWGTVSAASQKAILKNLRTEVNWRQVLRYFIGQSQKAESYSTVRRINRRFPYIHPGRRYHRTANIAISIDMSGSVDDSMLSKFFSELNKLSELATFTVIPFDSAVFEEKIFVWKKGSIKPAERVLYGGTNFDAPTNYVNEHGFDGHIILTDLCAPFPGPSKAQRMWMTTRRCLDNYGSSFTKERVIALEDPERG